MVIEFNIRDNKSITFIYSDNGIGFNISDSVGTNKGFGLNSIQHRIKTLKGIMSIESETGKGMKASIQLPADETSILINPDQS